MALLKKYRALVDQGVIAPDPAQSTTAARLDALGQRLRKWRRRTGLAAWLRGKEEAPEGLYIFGPVGRGKTMLMDLFFQTTKFRPKRRVHFHEFMAEVHDRIGAARKKTPGDPIPRVARELAAKSALLCFDEMHVTDIADAMILSRLFKGLFEHQVVVVATSNVPPSELYKNGLNRQLFLPFIDLLKARLDVVEVAGARDDRMERLRAAGTWFTPNDPDHQRVFVALWDAMLDGEEETGATLEVLGRHVTLPRASGGMVRASFASLCAVALGPNDYLALAAQFHTVFLENVPKLTPPRREEARRFVTLIDALYEARVRLIVLAEAEPAKLYPQGEGAFEFERTASRLEEMRSADWLQDRG